MIRSGRNANTMEHQTTTPDTAELAGWLHSWVTDEGAINGFHNHSVGHQPGHLPRLHQRTHHVRRSGRRRLGPGPGRPAGRAGVALLRRLLRYQCSEVQPDGQYAHIGFQVGESATSGLIHNAVGSLGMLLAVRHAGHLLPAEEVAAVLAAVRRNLDACEVYGGGRPGEEGTCNQEYARVWVKQLYTELSDDKTYAAEIPEDLAELIALPPPKCPTRRAPARSAPCATAPRAASWNPPSTTAS